MTPDVVSELYRVFSPYRIGGDFTGCDHCVDPAQSNYLASKPLAEPSVEDLENYAFKAMTTWGEVSHFKHFLPRLFELVLSEGIDAFSFPETMFGKLDYGRWTDWPTAERRAVANYLRHFWQSQLQREVASQNEDTIDTALCALGNAQESVDDFLKMWLQSFDATAVRQLAQFIWINADGILAKHQLWNSFWEGRPGAEEVVAWIKTNEVAVYLQQASTTLTDHLQFAQGQLEAIRAAED